MPVVPLTIHLPDDLWRAVQALVPYEGDTNTLILRAPEECVTVTQQHCGRQRRGKDQKLVKAVSTPVADVHLSARSATALRALNVKYVYQRSVGKTMRSCLKRLG
jgi:hypothetical protein